MKKFELEPFTIIVMIVLWLLHVAFPSTLS